MRKAIDPPVRSGYPMNYRTVAEIMAEIANLTPIYGGISHGRLGKGGTQWPCWNSLDERLRVGARVRLVQEHITEERIPGKGP